MSSAGAESLWVVVPAGQRRDGSWIDDTLVTRTAEAADAAAREPGGGGLGPSATRAPDAGRFPRQRVELFRGPGAAEAVDVAFRRRGWTDGLPVMPPTTARVADLVAVSGRNPQEVMGELAPLGGLATVERVAANAVMAGCGPEQFGYVLAAVSAVCDPAFNLAGVQTTDENVTPLVVISAPAAARSRAELNAGFGVLGPGWRGNATIGRAVRFALNNLGGGWPGVVAFAGAGQPGRYTLVVPEDDETCPWPPLRVELGHGVDDAVVVVSRAESAVNVTGGVAEVVSAMGSAASAFTALHGGSAAVLLAPHTARELAAQGLSRRQVAERLCADASIPAEVWRRFWVAGAVKGAAALAADDGSDGGGGVPVLTDPDRLLVVVAGGTIPIPQHVWFPGWGFPPAHVVRVVGR